MELHGFDSFAGRAEDNDDLASIKYAEDHLSGGHEPTIPSSPFNNPLPR